MFFFFCPGLNQLVQNTGVLRFLIMTILFNVFSLKKLRLFLQWLFIGRLFHLWRTGVRIQLPQLNLTWQCGVHTLQSSQMPLQKKKSPAVTSKLCLLRITPLLGDALFHGPCYTTCYTTLHRYLQLCFCQCM